MAIDREIICERITRGGETPAYSWVPPAVSDYEPPQADYAGWARERRLDQARTLYREAGYGPDNPLTLELRYNTSESHKKLASVVANMWRVNLGVKVTLINEEWKVFLQNVRQRQVTQVYRAGWIGDYDDPQTFLSLLHSDFGLNGTGFSNDRYDELLDTAARTPAGEKRRALMQQAEALLLEAQPVIPVYFYTSKTLLKPYVKGFVGNPMGHYYSKDLSIEWGGRDELPGAELPDDAS
jgi:oligopeptide transport system substrate-binding protein